MKKRVKGSEKEVKRSERTNVQDNAIVLSLPLTPFLSLSFFIILLLTSCGNDMSDIERFERENPPDQEVKDAHVWRSEEGKLQLELDAPTIVQFRQPDTRTDYPDGVELRLYNDERQLTTLIRAKKATSFDDKNILTASDNVVVIDYSNGDTVYLKDITWESDNDIIYSHKPVRAVNAGRVTYGDGFISDGDMTNLRITRQRGTIEIED
jgi:LPS export ABC transporter protein LptC